MVGCGSDSATAKAVSVTTSIIYLPLGPEVEKLHKILKILLFGPLRLAKRSRVNDVAIVLMQVLRNKVHVPRLESVKPFVEDLDLWGIEGF